MLFDNPISKVQTILDAMERYSSVPKFECFDVGIVHSVNMFVDTNMATHPDYNFVIKIASKMPADPELLPLLVNYRRPESPWQITAIGRADI